MNAAEFETIAALAAACGLGNANYLRTRGMSPLESSGESVMTLPQKRAWVAELYAVKRVLRGSTTNLNQLTKAVNATSDVPPEVWHHIERISRMEERVTALLDAVDPELKPRS